jgi:inositol-phosphate phosphatase / L-galactose 1-phosphate phosphatase / histidinol-phosphatase
MNDTQITAFAESAELMAVAAGNSIRKGRQQAFHTEFKGDGSPVTDVDKETEDCIRAIITERYPDHGILGEERDAVAPEAEFVWLIDPIDGTLPFLAGIPVFGTLIALIHEDIPIVGIIDMPMTDERWVGRHGMATLRNGSPVQTRPCSDLSAALLSTSNPDYYLGEDVKALAKMRDATKITVYGGSCMAYAQIATGRIDVGMDVQFDIHDYLPFVPIIQGAGGVITNWGGDRLSTKASDKILVAGDKRAHEQAIRVLGA